MTFEEIQEYAEHELKMGYRPIKMLEDEYVNLMVGGGLGESVARRNFKKLKSEKLRRAFLYSESIDTLVFVKGMSIEHWLEDHPDFKIVTSFEAGDITASKGWGWTGLNYYYGGDDREYDGACIASACEVKNADYTYSMPR